MTNQEIFNKYIKVYHKEDGGWTAVAICPPEMEDSVRNVMSIRGIPQTFTLTNMHKELKSSDVIIFSKGNLPY